MASKSSDSPTPDTAEAVDTTGSTTPATEEGAPLADPGNPYAGAEVVTPGELGGKRDQEAADSGKGSSKG